MSKSELVNMSIHAELRAEAAIAQIINFEILEASDHVFRDDSISWLDLSLTPRPHGTRACYPDQRGTQRLKDLGELFCVPPGEVLRASCVAGAQRSLVCRLDTALIATWSDGATPCNDGRLDATLDIRDDHIRCLMMRLAREVNHPGFASEMLLDLIAGQLAIELGRYRAVLNSAAAHKGLTARRLRLIEERVREPGKTPSLSELATLCGLSVRQLSRGFRLSRGCSIGHYVEQRRIEAAKRLLADGETVKAVAYSMGFASLSSFSYAFRRATGICPREFRQNMRSPRVPFSS